MSIYDHCRHCEYFQSGGRSKGTCSYHGIKKGAQSIACIRFRPTKEVEQAIEEFMKFEEVSMKSAKTKMCMTATECVNTMRSYGIPCTMKSLMDGIINGYYPFGRIISAYDAGKRSVQIFRVDFENWIESKMPKGGL